MHDVHVLYSGTKVDRTDVPMVASRKQTRLWWAGVVSGIMKTSTKWLLVVLAPVAPVARPPARIFVSGDIMCPNGDI